jgi:hypothetical protein
MQINNPTPEPKPSKEVFDQIMQKLDNMNELLNKALDILKQPKDEK